MKHPEEMKGVRTELAFPIDLFRPVLTSSEHHYGCSARVSTGGK